MHFSSAGPVAYRVRLLIYRVFLPLVKEGLEWYGPAVSRIKEAWDCR